jgi:hypothetical protein
VLENENVGNLVSSSGTLHEALSKSVNSLNLLKCAVKEIKEYEDTVTRKSSLKGPWITKKEWIKLYSIKNKLDYILGLYCSSWQNRGISLKP